MLFQNANRSFKNVLWALAVSTAATASAGAGVLATESFFLPSGPGNPAAAPTTDMVVNTSPLTTWGEKGAVGLQGSQSVFTSNGTTFVNDPASIVTFKFNIGSVVDSLNTTYGKGNWTISSPTLSFQYTYYANNPVFGGGAGTFETYWVANDTWAYGNGAPAGNSLSDNDYVSGTDPAYATNGTDLATWAGSDADLGSTTYNWLSPTNNPNYSSWSTAKSGPNQGMIMDGLALNSTFVSDITSATGASNSNVSLYLVPTSDTLGLTIFTGGGTVTPELSFNVIGVPEPTVAALLVFMPLLISRRRK